MYSAEVGWFWDPSDAPLPRAYKTWVNAGVATAVSSTQNIANLNVLHNLKVHDQNRDHQWSFAWDGNALGNQFVNFDWGTPVDESERCNHADSLYARFTKLRQIGCANCGWVAYSGLVKWVDNASDYSFCKISSTNFWVKQVC